MTDTIGAVIKFAYYVEDQFVYGGKKYANTSEKEVTDILTEDYGLKGLLWCINKYAYRYRNQGLEKDPLKIACYMFIMWLKFGLHQKTILSYIKRFLGVWVNTTVDVKSKHFPKFIALVKVTRLEDLSSVDATDRSALILELTRNLRLLRNPLYRTEKRLLLIFKLAERLWILGGFADADVHNTDTGR